MLCSSPFIAIVTDQLYESERTANDLLRKELQQMKQELNKMRSEVEVAKAVAAANESSSRRTDAMLAVSIHLTVLCAYYKYYYYNCFTTHCPGLPK